jgi:hypothetical protein
MTVTSHPHPEFPWIMVHTRTCSRGHETRKSAPSGTSVEFPSCTACGVLLNREKRKKSAAEAPEVRQERKQTREENARRRRPGFRREPELLPWMESHFAAAMLKAEISLDVLLSGARAEHVATRRALAKALFAGGATLTQISRAICRDFSTCRDLVHGVRR